MPKGNPKPQTKATDKYQKKIGYIVKGFKLKRVLVEQYEQACERAGVNQTAQIREPMEQFINEHSEKQGAFYRTKEYSIFILF